LQQILFKFVVFISVLTQLTLISGSSIIVDLGHHIEVLIILLVLHFTLSLGQHPDRLKLLHLKSINSNTVLIFFNFDYKIKLTFPTIQS